jgi:membrane-bound serine protease (ClpP class)
MKCLRLILLTAVAAAAVASVARAGDAPPRVLAIEFRTDVNPVSADYLIGQLDRAEREGYAAAVILLDTPGGLSDSMREIYQRELALEVPVIVYVWPNGARAASAGVWIGQAADVLAMAPQTNIGSSTPVGIGGEEIPEDVRNKVVNDAVASIRAITEEHGRNADWAEQAVRKGSNLEASAALEQNVVDLIAPDLPTLLERVDGRKAPTKDLTLHTAGAAIEHVEMSLWKRILNTLINPNIIVLLMSIGVLGIVVELWNPGLIFPGTVGAISLIVGLFGLSVLPVSWAGVLLMLLAAGFFVAEVFVPSHGALTLAGAASFVVGALILFDPAGPAFQVSLPVALAVAGTMAAFTLFVVAKLIEVRRRPVEIGDHMLVGMRGLVGRGGWVHANGELWRAAPVDGEPLREGEEVVVEGVEGLMLVVRRDQHQQEPSHVGSPT